MSIASDGIIITKDNYFSKNGIVKFDIWLKANGYSTVSAIIESKDIDSQEKVNIITSLWKKFIAWCTENSTDEFEIIPSYR